MGLLKDYLSVKVFICPAGGAMDISHRVHVKFETRHICVCLIFRHYYVSVYIFK